MSRAGKIQVDVQAKTGKALQQLRGLQKEIQKTGTAATQANRKLNSGSAGGLRTSNGYRPALGGGGLTKGAMLGGAMSNLQGLGGGLGGGKLLDVAKAAGPIGAAFAAVLGGAVALNKNAEKRSEHGRALYTQERTLNTSLGQLSKNFGGSGFTEGLTSHLIELGVKGKTPIEELTKSAQRLMLAFKGNQTEVKKWINIIADLSAGTGQSAQFFTEIITKAQQFGTVENEVLKQLNEKGIPIYQAIAKQLGISVDRAKELAKQGKITADEFQRAAEEAAKVTRGANEANIIKDQAYWNKQREHLKQGFDKQIYTRRMDEYKAARAQEIYQADKALYDDENVKLFHETLARFGVGIEQFCDAVKDFILVTGANAMTKATANAMAWLDNKVNGTQQHNAAQANLNLAALNKGLSSQAKAHGVSVADLAYNMDENGTAGLSSRIEEMKKAIQTAEARLRGEYVDDSTRANGRAIIAEATEHLRILEQTLAKKQEDIKLEQQRQAQLKKSLELQEKYLLENAQTQTDFVTAWNLNHDNKFDDTATAKWQVMKAKERLATGRGTESDSELVKYFSGMADMEDKLRTWSLTQKANKGDAQAKLRLDLYKVMDGLKGVGLSKQREAEYRQETLTDWQKQRENKLFDLINQQEEINKKILNFGDAINKTVTCFETNQGFKTEYERGAWGQGLAMAVTDQTYYQQAEQTRQLTEQNKKLGEQIALFKQEIEAIKKLNVTPRAL